MRRLLLASIAAVTSTLALAAAPAQAASGHCTESGDTCWSAVKRDGVVRLYFTSFGLRGRVQACVTAPDGTKACRAFRMRSRGGGLYQAKARWSAHFPNKGRGTYRVTYAAPGNDVPFRPSVTFRR